MEIDSKILIALIAFVAAIASTVVTQFILIKKFKKTIHENYRKVFFEKQLNAYQQFWIELKPLSRLYNKHTIISKRIEENKTTWFLNEKPSRNFCNDVTTFFFSEHGIFLGKTTRSHLFSFRNKIHDLIDTAKIKDGKIALSNELKKNINKETATLITSIRADIGVLNLKFNFEELELGDENNVA
ncbi:hypothetical protein [Lacinutrix sp. MEBiC02595]